MNKTVIYRSRTRQSGTSTHLSRTCLPAAHESRASASTPLATDGQPPSATTDNVRGKSHLRSVIAWLRTGHTGFPISNGTCALHRRRNALIARPSASRHALRQTQGTSPPRIIVTRSTRSSPQPTIIYENSICSPPDAPSSPSSMRTPSGAPNPTGRTRSSRR